MSVKNKLISLVAAIVCCFTLPSWAADKVLMVLTSHSELGTSGKPTGFWLSELTHPYYVIKDAGYTVDVVSIKGGIAPIDPGSMEQTDPINQRFLADAELMAKVLTTEPLADVDSSAYRAIIFAGGHGTMWDFANNAAVNQSAANIYQTGGVVAAVCHGPAALTGIKLADGNYLVADKKLAAFTNEEEAAIELTKVVPFSLEDKLKTLGAVYVTAPAWSENVVVDQRLVTGQNPQSAHKLGEAVVKLLSK